MDEVDKENKEQGTEKTEVETFSLHSLRLVLPQKNNSYSGVNLILTPVKRES